MQKYEHGFANILFHRTKFINVFPIKIESYISTISLEFVGLNNCIRYFILVFDDTSIVKNNKLNNAIFNLGSYGRVIIKPFILNNSYVLALTDALYVESVRKYCVDMLYVNHYDPPYPNMTLMFNNINDTNNLNVQIHVSEIITGAYAGGLFCAQ